MTHHGGPEGWMKDWARIERLLGWHRSNEERLRDLWAGKSRCEGVMHELEADERPRKRYAETFGELEISGIAERVDELAVEGIRADSDRVRARTASLRKRQRVVMAGLKKLGLTDSVFVPYGPRLGSGDRFVRLRRVGPDSPELCVVSGAALRAAAPNSKPWEIQRFEKEFERYKGAGRLERLRMWGLGLHILVASAKMVGTGLVLMAIAGLVEAMKVGFITNTELSVAPVVGMVVALFALIVGSVGLLVGALVEIMAFYFKKEHMRRVQRALAEDRDQAVLGLAGGPPSAHTTSRTGRRVNDRGQNTKRQEAKED